MLHVDFVERTYHPQDGDEGSVLGELRIVPQMNVFDHAFSMRGDWNHGVVVGLLLGCRRHIGLDASVTEVGMNAKVTISILHGNRRGHYNMED
jgi:hypothetical protein